MLIVVPTLAFLLASMLFAKAFAPRLRAVSLNIVSELTATIDGMIEHQHRWNRAGLWVFVLATLLSAIGMMNALLFWQMAPTK